MNKSALTNLVAVCAILAGLAVPNQFGNYLFYMGIFAFSGAITNWLAVYMLFERIPFVYGSGVIPNRFEAFKAALLDMVMNNFFTKEHIEKYVTNQPVGISQDKLRNVAAQVNWNPAFDGLLEVVEKSSFGSMLAMVGGTAALEPMREPFCSKIGDVFVKMAGSEKFTAVLVANLQSDTTVESLQNKLAKIVSERLDELTPQMIKEIVHRMINEHLGWLVIWGGVFGGVIGLLTAIVTSVMQNAA